MLLYEELSNKIVGVFIRGHSELRAVHEAQLLNYLHISNYRRGYLVNFQGQRAVASRLLLEVYNRV